MRYHPPRHDRMATPALLWWGVAAVVLGALLTTWVALNQPDRPLHRAGSRVYTKASIAIAMAAVAHNYTNVPYCGTSNKLQQLDLFVPKTGRPPFPLVVFIHGGGWGHGSKSDPLVRSYGVPLVKQQVAFASLNYRLAPTVHFPIPDQDVSCALSFLYSHASQYHVRAKSFGLMAASAGNQLASYAVLNPDNHDQPWRSSIRGVVDFYGVTSLTDAPPGGFLAGSVARFLGPAQQDQAPLASPISYAGQPAPPYLIFHGVNDRHVPFSQSQEFASDLIAAGNQATLIQVQDAGHGFGTHDQPSTTQIQQQVTGFFHRVLSAS